MDKFKPPEELVFDDGSLAEKWTKWRQRFELYLLAIDATAKPDKVKVAMLLTSIGEAGMEVYNNFEWIQAHGEGANAVAGEDKENLETVLAKFQNYCKRRDPQMMLRFQFWQHKRPEGQTFDQYLTELKTMATNCKFVENENMLRDKIAFSVTDERLKMKLLSEGADLTLTKVVNLCRLAESTRQEFQQMSNTETVNFVKHKTKKKVFNKKPQSTQQPATSQSGARYKSHKQTSGDVATTKPKNPCRRCGTVHGYRECPAYGATCLKCSGKNHYAKYCKTKNRDVHAVNDESEDEFFIHTTTHQIGVLGNDAWFSILHVAGHKIKFKLDTGATTNVLPLKTFKKLSNVPPLISANTKLTAYGGGNIPHLGKAVLNVSSPITPSCNSTPKSYEFYVTDHTSPPILGLQACNELGLVKKGNEENIYTFQGDKAGSITKDIILKDYADIFTGLGRFKTPYHIVLDPECTPVVHAPRRVPLSLHDRLKTRLQEMEEEGVICKVDQPTAWVSSLVIVEKKDSSLRLCLDPADLNKVIKREHFQIPSTEDITSKLGGKKLFTILDQKNSYWQVPLDSESSFLCTFNTPFGRYRFTRMPFGISSASEVLQKRNYSTFGDIPGVHILADDMIIAAENEAEHDATLIKVMNRAKEENVRFNPVKMQFKVKEVKYLGNIITAEGLKPDDTKIAAILKMPDPECKQDLQRALGMMNYLSQFIPNMSTITTPLRDLLKKDSQWQWFPEHDKALHTLKQCLVKAPVLKFFEPKCKTTTIQCDASSTGLGACLLQEGHPIAYSSRSLTKCEQNYAQIEKELLAICFATERFHQYVYGHTTIVHTDHKPLEAIIKKPLHKASPRLQLMLLRLLRYNIQLKYVPGKYMYIADTLSRAYTDIQSPTDDKEMDLRVHSLVTNLNMSDTKLSEVRAATESDSVLQEVRQLVKHGWPSHKRDIPQAASQFWPVKDEIHEIDTILYLGDRIIIPTSMRREMIQKIHQSHLGIEKCKSRAKSLLYWPQMSLDIEQAVNMCAICAKYRNNNVKEPLIPHVVPEGPWSKLGADIFEFRGKDYLLVSDYFSKYPELCSLKKKTAKHVIDHLKPMFARHGIPDKLICDNMPFASREMQNFAKQYGFQITTSSPRYPQSNGFIERTIQTVKQMLRKCHDDNQDVYLALLSLRNSQVTGMSYTPAQMLMSRRLQDTLPAHKSTLAPKVAQSASDELREVQRKQKLFYDRGSQPLPGLQDGEIIRIRKGKTWEPARVVNKHETPRSYIVEDDRGQIFRRNRRHLLKTGEKEMETHNMLDQYMADYNEIPPNVTPPTPVSPTCQSHSPTKPATYATPLPMPATNSTPATLRQSHRRITRPPKRLDDYVRF